MGGGISMRIPASSSADKSGRALARRLGITAALGGLAALLAVSPAVARASPARPARAMAPAAGQSTAAPAAGQTASVPAPPTNSECVERLVRVLYPKTGFAACYSPFQLQRAYGLLPLYAKGFNGRGRTIVVADPFGSPTIRHDLAVFDRAFRLPAPPSFRIIQPAGRVPPYNPGNPLMVDKAGETTLDVEVAHAMAPGACILLVETPGTTGTNITTGGGYPQLMAAENYVIRHNLGDVITQSFSLPEQNFPRGAIQRLRSAYVNAFRHHVTVLAASNDNGVTGINAAENAYYRHRVVEWPASDPLVTGVGGIKLFLNAAGRSVLPVAAWNDTYTLATPTPWASNGGLSRVFGRPSYQDSVRRVAGAHRAVPDVSLSAALTAGVLVYASFPGNTLPFNGWGPGGGTSEATPEFAGVVAVADQYAGKRLGLVNPALYRLSRAHAPGIVDVTRGNNTVSFVRGSRLVTVRGYRATRGYDLVTGVGTINAARLVPELARGR
jgi:subtilase family serine protease